MSGSLIRRTLNSEKYAANWVPGIGIPARLSGLADTAISQKLAGLVYLAVPGSVYYEHRGCRIFCLAHYSGGES